MDVSINSRFSILLTEKSKKEGVKISLQDVEAVTGISRQSLYAWKDNNLKRFEVKTIEQLCKYFQCQISDLLEVIPDEVPEVKPTKKK